MDWLRSEDLKEEKNVTAPIAIIAVHALCRCHESRGVPLGMRRINPARRPPSPLDFYLSWMSLLQVIEVVADHPDLGLGGLLKCHVYFAGLP
jgi:hypothetical protein